MIKKKQYIVIFVIAFIHWLMTFATDKTIFVFPDGRMSGIRLMDYSVCKFIAFLLLLFVYHSLYKFFVGFKNKNSVFQAVLCGLPYLVILIGITVVRLKYCYGTTDEYYMLNNAINLNHDTWFTYISIYYYIISLMIFPHKFGPVFLKLAMEFAIVGYSGYRFKNVCESNLENSHKSLSKVIFSKLYYLFYLMYPVLAYTLSAHRLPIYFWIYQLIFVIFIFDKLEKKKLTIAKAAFLVVIGSVLSQWRSEGIYLIILIPILIFLSYENSRNIKNVIFIIGAIIIMNLIVRMPQNSIKSSVSDAPDYRMKDYYASIIVNMLREGLDRNVNASDLAVVDRFLPINEIDFFNAYFGDRNYTETFIVYGDNSRIRPEATHEDYVNFVYSIQNIMKNNVSLFAKTRVKTFLYAVMPYRISELSEMNGIVSKCMQIVKAISYNVLIPMVFLLALLVYSLFYKKWFTFFMCGGVLGHGLIVFAMAPASYFKYYFPIYTCGYMLMIMLIIQLIYKRKFGETIEFIQ